MILDYLEKIKKIAALIPQDVKSCILVIILIIFQSTYSNNNLIDKIQTQNKESVKKAEKYTDNMSYVIDTQLKLILLTDSKASNVLLLSYHNSTHSSQGFSYKFVTYLNEVTRSIDCDLHEEIFKELSWLSYAEELKKIHNNGVTTMTNLEDLKIHLPKFYRKIKSCNDVEAVTFIPLEGLGDPIGLIVILYDKELNSNYKLEVTKYAQKLVSTLDYDTTIQ